VNWEEARKRSIEAWSRVQDSIGTADVTQLLTSINEMSELCDKAVEASQGEHRCKYCVAYQQLGGCQDLTALLSHYVAEKNWPMTRKLAAEFMDRLKKLDLPAEPA
jgi:hypothetical protein